MFDQMVLDNTTYTAKTETTELLEILLRHLERERAIEDPLTLSEMQMLTLKGWLLTQAEKLEPGQVSMIEQCIQVDPPTYMLEAAVGKREDGVPFIWHSGQPWPPGSY